MNFESSIKTGVWRLHLHSIVDMLPCFCTYDHRNYSGHQTYCLSKHQKVNKLSDIRLHYKTNSKQGPKRFRSNNWLKYL